VQKSSTMTRLARVYTSTLRIFGHLHTPPQSEISGSFNHQRPFFPMTDCKVYKAGLSALPEAKDLMATPDFLITPKATVLWIGGLEAKDLLRRDMRNLYLIYDHYILKGEVSIPANMRLADFLSRAVHEKPFQYLFNAELRLPQEGKTLLESPVVERLEVALVNVAKASALFDITEDNRTFDLSGF
jgi:hypothetical protein